MLLGYGYGARFEYISPFFKEGPYDQTAPPFRGWSISLFLLARKVYNIIIIVPPDKEGLFGLHQAFHRSIQNLLQTEAWLTHQQLTHWYSHTRAL